MSVSILNRISALADPTRSRILLLLDGRELMVGELCAVLQLPQSTVSRHLKILSDAGLIACRRKGQFVYSEAVPETIAAYAKALAKIARGRKATRRR